MLKAIPILDMESNKNIIASNQNVTGFFVCGIPNLTQDSGSKQWIWLQLWEKNLNYQNVKFIYPQFFIKKMPLFLQSIMVHLKIN